MINIKKITTAPQDEWEAISALVKTEQHLLSALHILESVLENNGEEYKEIHEKNIKKFLAQFQIEPKPAIAHYDYDLKLTVVE